MDMPPMFPNSFISSVCNNIDSIRRLNIVKFSFKEMNNRFIKLGL